MESGLGFELAGADGRRGADGSSELARSRLCQQELLAGLGLGLGFGLVASGPATHQVSGVVADTALVKEEGEARLGWGWGWGWG